LRPCGLPVKIPIDGGVFRDYQVIMNVGVLFERVQEAGFPDGYYYAHIPTLGLTTHGLGIDGARAAALDLARLWLAEKNANGESCPAAAEILFSTLELPDNALQKA